MAKKRKKGTVTFRTPLSLTYRLTKGDFEWAANKLLKGAGAGSDPTEIDIPFGIPSGVIVMWHGTIATIPTGFVICDGNNSTPNLLAKFVEGVATAATDPGATGGATAKTTTGHQHVSPLPRGSVTAEVYGYGGDGPFGTEAQAKTVYKIEGTSEVVATFQKTKSNTDSITDIRPLFYDVAFIMKT